MTKMTDEQIQAALGDLPEWSQLNGEIQRTYQFADFRRSIAFVMGLAERAEEAQHHPDILIRYNKVTLTLSTHDAGGITQKDFDLAMEANALAGA